MWAHFGSDFVFKFSLNPLRFSLARETATKINRGSFKNYVVCQMSMIVHERWVGNHSNVHVDQNPKKSGMCKKKSSQKEKNS